MRRLHPQQDLLPLAWVTQGKGSHSAYLLPVPAQSKHGLKTVKVHWVISDYDSWVPASTVALAEEGRRSGIRQEKVSNEAQEELTLQALSVLLAVVKTEREGRRGDSQSRSSDVAAPVASRTSSRRGEKSLLTDSTVQCLGPTFDNRGNHPRKAPELFALRPHKQQPSSSSVKSTRKSKEKAPAKASVGKLNKKKALRSKTSTIYGESKYGTKKQVRIRVKPVHDSSLGPKCGAIAARIMGCSSDNRLQELSKAGKDVVSGFKADNPLLSKNSKLEAKSEKTTSVKANSPKLNKETVAQANKIWTTEDDCILRRKHAELGPRWGLIATFIKDSTHANCRARFEHLKKEPKKASSVRQKVSNWNSEEDSILQQRHAMYGNKWCRIAEFFTLRDGNACRKRFMQLNPGHAALRSKRPLKRKPIKKSNKPRFTAEDICLIRAYIPQRYVLKKSTDEVCDLTSA